MYNKNVKRRKKLKVEIKLEENCSETKVIIITDKITEDISQLSCCRYQPFRWHFLCIGCRIPHWEYFHTLEYLS